MSIEYYLLTRNIDCSSFLCHVSLCDADKESDMTIVKRSDLTLVHHSSNIDNTVPYQNLVGQRIASGRILHDTDGQKQIFFIFADLAVRTIGKYRLLCKLIDMTRYWFLI